MKHPVLHGCWLMDGNSMLGCLDLGLIGHAKYCNMIGCNYDLTSQRREIVMSELRVETYRMPAARLGSENPLPPLDGRMPHRLQDDYDRTRKERRFRAVVLENEVLRATFLTGLGGRLWSLFHKPSNRELLYVNPVFQPGNLAIRNAWFSGGVEWNVGVRGHAAYTCSPLFAARVQEGDGSLTSVGNGLPVLRMYEWDRVRMTPYQIDAFLPDDSMFLLVRVRIINPHDHEVPMYWWSNIAVPETPEVRVLSPAEQAYKYGYKGKMTQVSIPISDGIDLSYPTNFSRSGDCFYCIDTHQQPWITALDGQGRGLIQTSTARLRGRKLFVWGMGPGGRHWQEFLSVPDSPYIEIQAGLARTQSEYIPMPAGAEWTWLEAYGLMEADPEVVHGSDWRAAYHFVDEGLNEMMPLELLESKLLNSNDMADRPPDEIIQPGSGWGALERRRRERSGEKPFCPPSMAFSDDSLGADQEPWLALLVDGALPYVDPTDLPGGWMIQSEWRQLLEDAVHAGRGDHWLAWLHLGVMYYSEKDIDAAKRAWEKSLTLEPSPWAYRNMAVLAKHEGRLEEAAGLLLAARQMAPQMPSLALECCRVLIEAGRSEDMLNLMDDLPPQIRGLGRMRIIEAQAAMKMGDLQRVEDILRSRPPVADVREGEVTLSNLWFEMHEKRIAAEGNIPIDDKLHQRVRRDYPPPSWLDFRQAT
jgi:tetratricopeptide (TPR) repeat protein